MTFLIISMLKRELIKSSIIPSDQPLSAHPPSPRQAFSSQFISVPPPPPGEHNKPSWHEAFGSVCLLEKEILERYTSQTNLKTNRLNRRKLKLATHNNNSDSMLVWRTSFHFQPRSHPTFNFHHLSQSSPRQKYVMRIRECNTDFIK